MTYLYTTLVNVRLYLYDKFNQVILDNFPDAQPFLVNLMIFFLLQLLLFKIVPNFQNIPF